MKKIFCILFINISIFLILIYALTCYLYRQPENNFLTNNISNSGFSDINIDNYPTEDENGLKHLTNTNKLYRQYCGEERTKINFNKNNNFIVVLGCSYAYGHGLNKEDTFGYLLSDITNRPILNLANCGGEAYSSLFLLKEIYNNDSELKEKIQNADYIVYVYMYDHIFRYLKRDFLINNYTELFKTNKLERFLLDQYLFRYLMSEIKQKTLLWDYPFNSKNAEQFLFNVINQIYRDSKNYSPNAKFIVILYDEKISNQTSPAKIKFAVDIMNSNLWSEFAKDNNAVVIHSKDIMGSYFDKKYKLNEDISEWHPNARAWKEFTPLFAEKYIH